MVKMTVVKMTVKNYIRKYGVQNCEDLFGNLLHMPNAEYTKEITGNMKYLPEDFKAAMRQYCENGDAQDAVANFESQMRKLCDEVGVSDKRISFKEDDPAHIAISREFALATTNWIIEQHSKFYDDDMPRPAKPPQASNEYGI